MGGLRLNRQQLAAFLGSDHDAVRKFESLFLVVDDIAPGVTDEVLVQAGTAEAKANQALGEIDRIASMVSYLESSPAEVMARQALDSVERLEGSVAYLETAPLFNGEANSAVSVTVLDAGADTTTWPMLARDQTGTQSPTTDAGLTYNASINALTTTTFVGALQGNAATATALQTARTINGVSFDGTVNITVTADAGTLTGSTLNATVTVSSLTSVGTIGTGTWNATIIAVGKGGTGSNLGATGGASRVLMQTSAGAAITVAQLAASDLSNGTSGSGAVALITSPTFVTPVLGVASASSLVVTAASSADASMSKNSAAGLKFQSIAGTSYDASLLTPGSTAYIWRVPTGTARFNLIDTTDSTGSTSGSATIAGGLGVAKRINGGSTIRTGIYTVATLPAGTQGDRAMVTDALAPAWGAAVAGGGAVVVPVYYAAAWTVG